MGSVKGTLHYLVSYKYKSNADKKLFEQTMEAVKSTGAEIIKYNTDAEETLNNILSNRPTQKERT